MSNYLAIATVSAILSNIINNGIQKDFQNNPISPITVTIQPPDKAVENNSGNNLNLFLYRTSFNNGYRNMNLPTRNSVGDLIHRPQLALDLHYLITAYSKDNDDLVTQQILASAMMAFDEKPVITKDLVKDAINDDHRSFLKNSDLLEQVESIKISPYNLSFDELQKLHSSFFHVNYRLSNAYMVTVVLLEGRAEPKVALPVRQQNITLMPFKRPIIERIKPPVFEYKPKNMISIIGRNLKDQTIVLKIDRFMIPVDVNSGDASDSIIKIEPPKYLASGVKSIQVINPLPKMPSTSSVGFESNAVPFVVAPRISKINNIDVSNNDPVLVNRGADLRMVVEPSIFPHQKTSLFVGDYSFSIDASNIDGPLFSWGDVPGNDENKLKDFLTGKFGNLVQWIQSLAFQKISEKKISLSNNDHSLTVESDLHSLSATVTLDRLEIYEFFVKKVNDKSVVFDGDKLALSIPMDMDANTYFLRLRVDGAQSLIIDNDENSATFMQYLGPKIKVT